MSLYDISWKYNSLWLQRQVCNHLDLSKILVLHRLANAAAPNLNGIHVTSSLNYQRLDISSGHSENLHHISLSLAHFCYRQWLRLDRIAYVHLQCMTARAGAIKSYTVVEAMVYMVLHLVWSIIREIDLKLQTFAHCSVISNNFKSKLHLSFINMNIQLNIKKK